MCEFFRRQRQCHEKCRFRIEQNYPSASNFILYISTDNLISGFLSGAGSRIQFFALLSLYDILPPTNRRTHRASPGNDAAIQAPRAGLLEIYEKAYPAASGEINIL